MASIQQFLLRKLPVYTTKHCCLLLASDHSSDLLYATVEISLHARARVISKECISGRVRIDLQLGYEPTQNGMNQLILGTKRLGTKRPSVVLYCIVL